MNILKIPYDRFEDVVIEVQKKYGVSKLNTQEQNDIAMLKLQRPKNFIFNSYVIKFDNGTEYKINRNENTYKHFLGGIESLSFTAKRDENGIIRPENISGAIPNLLAKKKMTDKEKFDKIADAIMSIVIPVICFERHVMQLMESRNVTTVDLEEVQTVVKTSKPGKKAKKKNKPRVTKEITLNFKDIERVVYSRPELPRTYTHHVESFDVAGHYRHYKSGKVVFVKGYTKGNKDAKQISDKTYKINL